MGSCFPSSSAPSLPISVSDAFRRGFSLFFFFRRFLRTGDRSLHFRRRVRGFRRRLFCLIQGGDFDGSGADSGIGSSSYSVPRVRGGLGERQRFQPRHRNVLHGRFRFAEPVEAIDSRGAEFLRPFVGAGLSFAHDAAARAFGNLHQIVFRAARENPFG